MKNYRELAYAHFYGEKNALFDKIASGNGTSEDEARYEELNDCNREEVICLKALELQRDDLGHGWTDGDIDAAYVLGLINSGPESIEKIQAESIRLKELGFNNPHEAVREIRYVKPKTVRGQLLPKTDDLGHSGNTRTA